MRRAGGSPAGVIGQPIAIVPADYGLMVADRSHAADAETDRFFHESRIGLFGRRCQQARVLARLVRVAENCSVLEAAVDSGDDSPSAFAAAFRRSFGVALGRYFAATAD